MDRKTVEHLRSAVEMCGFDFDEIISRHTNKRDYTDLRSIIWTILQDETGDSALTIGRHFGWNRTTVFCSIKKARELKEYDRTFRDFYDSVYGYYINFESAESYEEIRHDENEHEGVGETLDEQTG